LRIIIINIITTRLIIQLLKSSKIKLKGWLSALKIKTLCFLPNKYKPLSEVNHFGPPLPGNKYKLLIYMNINYKFQLENLNNLLHGQFTMRIYNSFVASFI